MTQFSIQIARYNVLSDGRVRCSTLRLFFFCFFCNERCAIYKMHSRDYFGVGFVSAAYTAPCQRGGAGRDGAGRDGAEQGSDFFQK